LDTKTITYTNMMSLVSHDVVFHTVWLGHQNQCILRCVGFDVLGAHTCGICVCTGFGVHTCPTQLTTPKSAWAVGYVVVGGRGGLVQPTSKTDVTRVHSNLLLAGGRVAGPLGGWAGRLRIHNCHLRAA
jgi:hypothetical protein